MKKFTLGLLSLALLAFALGSPALAQSKGTKSGDNVVSLLRQLARRVAKIDRQTTVPTSVKLSSGPFGLPEGAKSVDWVVLNDSSTEQTVKVTVFKVNTGSAKTVVVPGTITKTLGPNESTHNANSVGSVFSAGGYYEVVVEADSRSVLPMVTVWEANIAKPIAGSTIPSGSWQELR